jgi:hypothetical protein
MLSDTDVDRLLEQQIIIIRKMFEHNINKLEHVLLSDEASATEKKAMLATTLLKRLDLEGNLTIH